MVTSSKEISITPKLDQTETSSISYQNDSRKSLSEFELIGEYSFINQIKSGIKWFIDPFKTCCLSKIKQDQTSKNLFPSNCLKPEFNRVNGLLKYFTFGVMFTNGM